MNKQKTILFKLSKLDDASIFRHKDERKVKTSEEEQIETMKALRVEEADVEIEINDEEEDEQDDDKKEKAEEKNEATVASVSNLSNEKLEKDESSDSDEMCFPDTKFQVNLVSNIK